MCVHVCNCVFETLVCLFVQVDAEKQQLLERLEKQEEDHNVNILALDEKSQDAENQIKDMKETIFELEDQVEQQRAVRLHTNQTILDLESKSLFCSISCQYHFCSVVCGFKCCPPATAKNIAESGKM